MSKKQTLYELIELIKLKSGLNQAQIAEKSGYGRTYLSDALGKENPSPRIASKLKLVFAKELGLSLPYSNENILKDDGGINGNKKASIIKDVDAFLVSNAIHQEAVLQTIMEFLAEIGGPTLNRTSASVLASLQKRVEEKKEELTEAAGKLS